MVIDHVAESTIHRILTPPLMRNQLIRSIRISIPLIITMPMPPTRGLPSIPRATPYSPSLLPLPTIHHPSLHPSPSLPTSPLPPLPLPHSPLTFPPLILPPHAHNNRTTTYCSTIDHSRQSTPFQTSLASLLTIYNSRFSIPLWSKNVAGNKG